MRKRDFPPTGNLTLGGILRNKERKCSYELLRYLGCILSSPKKWFDHKHEYLKDGTDLGGGCRGAHPPEMKPSSSYSLLKFVYLTSQ